MESETKTKEKVRNFRSRSQRTYRTSKVKPVRNKTIKQQGNLEETVTEHIEKKPLI